jgi:hypothetical protein
MGKIDKINEDFGSNFGFQDFVYLPDPSNLISYNNQSFGDLYNH